MPALQATGMPSSSSIGDKVLDVLLLFDESRPQMTATEITGLIGAPRSTAYRYIRTLRERELLEKTEGGGFTLGPRVLQMARAVRKRLDIGQAALPIMEEIGLQTRETILLARRFGQFSVCVECVEGSQALRISFERGNLQPLHAGASYKVLLAYSDETEWDRLLNLPLEAVTENTITELDLLKSELHKIRIHGYCVSDGEIDLGARAVAVPIRNKRGQLLASLSVVGPTSRMNNQVIAEDLALLQAAAVDIQNRYLQADI
jgi:DNA-binding IclR family transcriptional regulator